MASIRNYLTRAYSELVLVSLLFLFFFELVSDLVSAVFALNLLTQSLNAYAVMIVVLLSSITLVFFKKDLPDLLLVIIGETMIVCRLVETFLNVTPKAIISGIGVGCFMIFFPAFILRKASQHTTDGERTALTLGIGLAFGVAMSILFRTIGSTIDISTFSWFQAIGWLLGAVAIIMLFDLLRKRSPEETANSEMAADDESSTGGTSEGKEEEHPANNEKPANFWKILGLSFGMMSILILIYYVLSSPTVISRCAEGNYLAIIILATLMILSFVILVAIKPQIISKVKPWLLWLWNSLFVIALIFMMVAHQPQYAIIQQILLYLTLILSPIILLDFIVLTRELIKSKPTARKLGGSFTIASFFFIVLIFAIIFTIAYDYIPIVGPFFRDKYWFVIMIIGLASILPVLLVKKGSRIFNKTITKSRIRRNILISITSVLLLGTIVSAIATSPFPKEPQGLSSLKVMTYNIQQGFDINGNMNFDGMLEVLKEADADIIGLQESDTCRISSGNGDIVRFIANKMNLYSYFGPKTVTGTFGIALLSKFPIKEPKTHYMYSEGEQTATIEAQITVGTRTFNVFVTHFGEYELDKEKQAEKIVEVTLGKENIILLGDFNFRPMTLQYNITTAVLEDAWLTVWPTGEDDQGYDGLTVDWETPHARIDYVFVSPDITLTDCRVLTEAHASDHMPVTAVIQL